MKLVCRLICAFFCLSTVLVLVSCNNSPGSTVVRLGYRPTALSDISPVILSELLRERAKVDVKLVALSSPKDGFDKFYAGEIDAIAGIPLEGVFQQIVEHGDPGFRAYGYQVDIADNTWLSIIAGRDAGINTLADGKGKVIASLPTDQARYLIRRILAANGYTEADTKITVYNPATPLVQLNSGENAMLFALEPAISRARVAGHLVLSAGPVSKFLFGGRPTPLSASVLNARFIKDNPAAADEFRKLVQRALDHQKSKPDEVRNQFSNPKYGGLSPAEVAVLSLSTTIPPSADNSAIMTEFAKQLADNGVLKKQIDPTILDAWGK
jgi:ABC-type nitrate/sulfonate/bicarbonate transport system substrate-binding protein